MSFISDDCLLSVCRFAARASSIPYSAVGVIGHRTESKYNVRNHIQKYLSVLFVCHNEILLIVPDIEGRERASLSTAPSRWRCCTVS